MWRAPLLRLEAFCSSRIVAYSSVAKAVPAQPALRTQPQKQGDAQAISVNTFERYLASLGNGIIAGGMSRPYLSLSNALSAERRSLSDSPPMRALLAIIAEALRNPAYPCRGTDLAHTVAFIASDGQLTPKLLRLVADRITSMRSIEPAAVPRLLRGLYALPPQYAVDTAWGQTLFSCLIGHINTNMEILSPVDAWTTLIELKTRRFHGKQSLVLAIASRFFKALPEWQQKKLDLHANALNDVLNTLSAEGFRAHRLHPGSTLGVPQRALPRDLEAAIVNAAIENIPRWESRHLSAAATALGTMGIVGSNALLQQTASAAAINDSLWLAIQARCVQLLPSMTMLDVVFIGVAFATATRRVAHEVVTEGSAFKSLALSASVPLSEVTTKSSESTSGSPRTPADLHAVVGDKSFWLALRVAITVHLPEMEAQHVGMALSSLLTANEYDESLVRVMLGRLCDAVEAEEQSSGGSSKGGGLFHGRFLDTTASVVWALYRAGCATEFSEEIALLCSAAARRFYDDLVGAANTTQHDSRSRSHVEHCLTLLRSAGQITGLVDGLELCSSPRLLTAMRQLTIATALHVNLYTEAAHFPPDAVVTRLVDTFSSILLRWRWLDAHCNTSPLTARQCDDDSVLLMRALVGSAMSRGSLHWGGGEEEGILRDAQHRLRAHLKQQRHSVDHNHGSASMPVRQQRHQSAMRVKTGE